MNNQIFSMEETNVFCIPVLQNTQMNSKTHTANWFV